MANIKYSNKIRTKQDYDEQRAKKIGEATEIIDEIGQDSEEKAAKAVKEINKAADKENRDQYDDTLQILQDNRKSIRGYQEVLASLLYNSIQKTIDFTPGFEFRVTHNEKVKGVGVVLKLPNGEFASRGFKPVGDPDIDLNALYELYWMVDNTVYDYQGEAHDQADNSKGD